MSMSDDEVRRSFFYTNSYVDTCVCPSQKFEPAKMTAAGRADGRCIRLVPLRVTNHPLARVDDNSTA